MINNRCINCRNYLGDLSCMAFDEIPDEILSGKNEHNKPLPNQKNDIVFESGEPGEIGEPTKI
tara:strand:- start:44 stop:232 length:189 start_codon:yes stop_codon:yes gene_type:complete